MNGVFNSDKDACCMTIPLDNHVVISLLVLVISGSSKKPTYDVCNYLLVTNNPRYYEFLVIESLICISHGKSIKFWLNVNLWIIRYYMDNQYN